MDEKDIKNRNRWCQACEMHHGIRHICKNYDISLRNELERLDGLSKSFAKNYEDLDLIIDSLYYKV